MSRQNRFFDLRFLIGLLFVIYGVIIALYGLFVNPPTVVGWNIDLWWGVLMLLFGLAFLMWSRKEEGVDD
jgi:uncharacterized membrane protein HdeD (DUF308 family)